MHWVASRFVFCLALAFSINGRQAQGMDLTSQTFTENGIRPSIAASDSGEFMILFTRLRWDLLNGSPSSLPQVPASHLFARLFHSDGSAMTEAFEVYSGAAFSGRSVVKSDRRGNFTCFWGVRPGSGANPYISFRRFDSNGRARTDVETVIRTGSNVEDSAIIMTFDVDMAPDGSFVVVWSESIDLYDARSVIYAQRFDSRSRKAGPRIRVTPQEVPPHQSQSDVRVSMDDEGGFVVTWLHRYFPEFPHRELSIDLKAAVYDPEGNALDSHLVLRHEELEVGHEHLPPRVKKMAGHGFVVMTNHTVMHELGEDEDPPSRTYSSTFEGRFYPENDVPSEIFSSHDIEIGGQSNFDLDMTEQGRIVLVFEDDLPDVKATRLMEFNPDFSIATNVRLLNDSGVLPIQAEALPVIQIREDGTYIYALTKVAEDFEVTRRQWIRGGIIQPDRDQEIGTAPLSVELAAQSMLSIEFETKPGKSYRLLRGGALNNLTEAEVFSGTGQRAKRLYPLKVGNEFFAVIEE